MLYEVITRTVAYLRACHSKKFELFRITSYNVCYTKLLRRQQIEQALGGHFARPFSLKILQEGEFRGETPARRQAREREARKQQAVQSIETDENVKALQDAFGATVNYDSIRPRE